MDLGLQNQTAIVTGAGRGIGLATAQALIAEGVHVVGAARRPSAELQASGALAVAVDLTQRDAAQHLLEAAVEAYGGVDLLVNNVGGGDDLTLSGFGDLDDDDWAAAFELNLFTAVRLTRAALPALLRNGGAIVNVSSIGAHQPAGPPLAYNVAKAALTAFGRGLAAELGPQGVRVLTVTPGPTRTAMWQQYATVVGAPLEAVIAGVPEQLGMLTGRLVEASEVADLITYLLSPRAASITGSDHRIDGGALRSA